jgi:hypothetical protein
LDFGNPNFRAFRVNQLSRISEFGNPNLRVLRVNQLSRIYFGVNRVHQLSRISEFGNPNLRVLRVNQLSQKRFHSQEESDGIPNKNKNKRFQPGHLPTSPLPIQESFQSQHLFPFSRVPDSIEHKFLTASLQSHFQRLSSVGSLRQTSFFWSSSLGLAIDTNQRQARDKRFRLSLSPVRK